MTMKARDDAEQSASLTRREHLIQELRKRKASGIKLRWEDFSFDICREQTKHIQGSISDLLREERDEQWIQ